MTLGEVEELKEEVTRWKRRYHAERNKVQELEDDIDRMETKLKAAMRNGLTCGRCSLAAAREAEQASRSATAPLNPNTQAAAAAASSSSADDGTAAAAAAAAAGDPEGGETGDVDAPADDGEASATNAKARPEQQPRKRGGIDDPRWLAKLEELRRFKEENGHCRAKITHPTLGRWVNRMRTEYAYLQKGERSAMTLERIQALDELGFDWVRYGNKSGPKKRSTWRSGDDVSDDDDNDDVTGETPKKKRRKVSNGPKQRAMWQEKFDELVRYRAEHGHCRVPYEHGALGKWAGRHRTEYVYFLNGKKSRLTSERIDQLNSIGFEWDVKGGRLNRDSL